MTTWLDATALAREALRGAAASVAPHDTDKSFQERRLEGALVAELTELIPGAQIIARKQVAGLVIPGWDPQPGAVDLVVTNTDGGARIVIELKIDDVHHSLWDILKLASLTQDPTVDAALVAVAARHGTWREKTEVVDLYQPPNGDDCDREWYTRFLLTEYARSWRQMLTYSARPIRLPELIYLGWQGAFEVPAYPGYELRVLAVTADDESFELENGWPVPRRDHTVPDDDLTLADVPSAGAALGDLFRFAGTTNGYVRCGSSDRCAELANTALEAWRATGALPSTLRDLRCCLFFEQRRDHFGFPTDERYMRDLVDGIRTLVQSRTGSQDQNSPPTAVDGAVGRTSFTRAEIERLRALLREKQTADASRQKTLRAQMRRLGFNISDFADYPGFVVSDLDDLIQRGTITVSDDPPRTRPN